MSETTVKAPRLRAPVKELPNSNLLNEAIEYSKSTGILTWRKRPRSHFKSDGMFKTWNTKWCGKQAGYKTFQANGDPHAIVISIKFPHEPKPMQYLAHRVIFKILDVNIPVGFEIDHKNGNPFDNAFENLRICTPLQNTANRKNMMRTKDVLPAGAYRKSNGFCSRITFNKITYKLGTFKTPEEASLAFLLKARELRGEFLRDTVTIQFPPESPAT